MDFDECMLFARDHPICAFTTIDGDRPRVRMLGMWFVDEKGFYFWTTKVKEVYRQLRENAKVELCFYAQPAGALVSFLHTKQLYAVRDGPLEEGGTIDLGKAMRASGTVVFLDDPKLRERLLEEPRSYVLLLTIWFFSALKRAKRGFGRLPIAGVNLSSNGLHFKSYKVTKGESNLQRPRKNVA